MSIQTQSFKPIGSLAVEIAVASVLTDAVVTSVEITLRSQTSLATPATFISDNSLESEVVSRAGLDQDTTFSSYVATSTTQYAAEYVYVITAAVTVS